MIKSLLVASVLLAGHATAQECALVKVPIYQTHDEWAGMALGGLIGSQVGNGSGKYIAGAIGALLGRHTALNTPTARIIGYKTVNVCNNLHNFPRSNNNLNLNLTTCNVGGRLVRC
tara:strand:- start:677 stop:1024 length:348 start_codon:yes stop_codon:yes gene_type:complete